MQCRESFGGFCFCGFSHRWAPSVHTFHCQHHHPGATCNSLRCSFVFSLWSVWSTELAIGWELTQKLLAVQGLHQGKYICGWFIKMLIRANRGKKFSEEVGRWSGSVLQVWFQSACEQKEKEKKPNKKKIWKRIGSSCFVKENTWFYDKKTTSDCFFPQLWGLTEYEMLGLLKTDCELVNFGASKITWIR